VNVSDEPIIERATCCPPTAAEGIDSVTVCIYNLLSSTLRPPASYPTNSTSWLYYYKDVHCLAYLVEYEWNQPSAAARAFLYALQTAPETVTLVQSLGQVLRRHPHALYAPSPRPEGSENHAISIISPQRYGTYNSHDAIPVIIRPGVLPQSRWQEIGMRVCSWFDDGHLPVCHPSFTVKELSPGWHRLHVQAYGLVTQTAISPIISMDFCVFFEQTDCRK